MTAQSWRSHYEQKYQYSLRLFLLLNLVSSVLSLVSPLFTVITFTLPCFLIVACSTVLLLWHCKFSAQNKYSDYFSDIWPALGMARCAKSIDDGSAAFNYLVIALLSVLFIGTIAFSSNIIGFTLHSIPTYFTCLILGGGEQWLRMSWCFLLPIAGITLQSLIQKRSDIFAGTYG